MRKLFDKLTINLLKLVDVHIQNTKLMIGTINNNDDVMTTTALLFNRYPHSLRMWIVKRGVYTESVEPKY